MSLNRNNAEPLGAEEEDMILDLSLLPGGVSTMNIPGPASEMSFHEDADFHSLPHTQKLLLDFYKISPLNVSFYSFFSVDIRTILV